MTAGSLRIEEAHISVIGSHMFRDIKKGLKAGTRREALVERNMCASALRRTIMRDVAMSTTDYRSLRCTTVCWHGPERTRTRRILKHGRCDALLTRGGTNRWEV